MEQFVKAVRTHQRNHGGMNGRGRAGVTAGEGNQVFIGALGSAEAVAKCRYRPFLERNDLAHAAILARQG